MTLRDEVAELVYVYANRRESGFAYPTDQMVANEILDKVREALLSNQVQAPIRQELHDYPRTSTRDTVKTVIEMALDAVTGEDDER